MFHSHNGQSYEVMHIRTFHGDKIFLENICYNIDYR
jgi:hypothetical protein